MNTQSKNKRLAVILLAIPVLLLFPLAGMCFSTGINWTAIDFIVMGALLLGAGLALELILRKVMRNRNRIVLLAATAIIFLLIWAELAVGIFGTPFAGS